MKSMIRTTRCLLAIAMAAAALGTAQATPVTVFGEDPAPAGKVNPDAAPAITKGVFEGKLAVGSLKTETFETQPVFSTSPFSILGGLATVTAVEAGKGTIENRTGGSNPTGRFNTTPDCVDEGTTCAWWQSSGSFSIDFGLANAVSAFGFYATDLADFGGTLQLELTDINGAVSTLDIKSSIGIAIGDTVPPSGTLAFFGFTDMDTSYQKIRFVVTQISPNDILGFDDIVIGSAKSTGGTVPEPATLALVALSLAGLAASRRKTQR